MSVYQPLRYQISNWRQLPQCRSNNSRELRITVSDFVQNFMLSGLKISIEHDMLGTLFACVINASGNLISPPPRDHVLRDLTTDQILLELEKFGFLVTYNPRSVLKGDQIQYLITLQQLHFDKLRILRVRHSSNLGISYTTHIVAFNVKQNPSWIDNNYSVPDAEFINSLQNGSAMDITNISDSHKYDWSWLDYVANIDDILKDNATIGT